MADRDIEIIERGDVTFFFRPSVQAADALVTNLGVQSFFMVLGSDRGLHRRVRVGRKRMPNRGERLWCRVERVGSLQRVIGDQMEDEHYVTKTRGERYQPGARVIGQGCYAFVRHGDHVHLAYRIEMFEPEAPEEVRPPEAASPVVLFERVPRTKATWTTVGQPRMLDEEGAELVLVGDDEEPETELGIDVLPVAGAVG